MREADAQAGETPHAVGTAWAVHVFLRRRPCAHRRCVSMCGTGVAGAHGELLHGRARARHRVSGHRSCRPAREMSSWSGVYVVREVWRFRLCAHVHEPNQHAELTRVDVAKFRYGFYEISGPAYIVS